MSLQPLSELVINRDVSLILVEPQPGAHLPDLPGRVLLAAAQANTSTQIVSQSSSTGSLCLCVPRYSAIAVLGALYDLLRPELASGIIRHIAARSDVAILTAIGAVREGFHLFSTLTEALAEAGINILVSASGFSGAGASVVIETQQVATAHRSLRQRFAQVTDCAAACVSKH